MGGVREGEGRKGEREGREKREETERRRAESTGREKHDTMILKMPSTQYGQIILNYGLSMARRTYVSTLNP